MTSDEAVKHIQSDLDDGLFDPEQAEALRVLLAERRDIRGDYSESIALGKSFQQRAEAAEARVAALHALINDDGSLTTDEEHLDILRDAMHAMDTQADTVAKLEAAEARLREVEAALRGVSTKRQFGPCWCDTVAGLYCVGQPRCEKAQAALASAPEPAEGGGK